MDEQYYDEYKKVLIDELSEFNIPVLYNLNFGHSFPRTIIPYGATATIDCNKMSFAINDSTLC